MKYLGLTLVLSAALAGNVYASDHGNSGHSVPKDQNKCIGAGPQAPRDIDSISGSNSVAFTMAPEIKDMNLCNIHFHRSAEHKSAAYSTLVKDGEHTGWACQEPAPGRLEMEHAEYNGCQGIAEGDTVEVHWVYTTCDINTPGVEPMGKGLSACMTSICANPELRVEAQVFTLQKNGELKFAEAPTNASDPVVTYIGSTTGPSYNNNHCSQFQVTWDVNSTCKTLDIDDFSTWCSTNEYKDNHAHGVRELVTPEALLSTITSKPLISNVAK